MGLLQQASLVTTPNAVKAGKLYSIVPTNGAGDLDVVRNTTATYVGADGLIKTALANVPRLDYSNGSCPSILVEPQRTNLHLNSQQMWSMTTFGTTTPSKVRASINSPQGVNNAVIVTGGNGSSGNWGIFQSISTIIPSGSQIAVSVFAKAGTHDIIFLQNANISISGLNNAYFNLSNGTTPTLGARIEDYGNGWYRCHLPIVTLTANTSTTYNIGHYVAPSTTSSVWTTNFNGKSVYFYGIQVEVGSNATSYIPTTTTSVTRNADVISKSGISSLIGQTEGVVYCELNITTLGQLAEIININTNNTGENVVSFNLESSNSMFCIVRANNVQILNIVIPSISLGINKIAFSYKSGNTKVYINGVLRTTNTSAFTFSNNFSFINVGNLQLTSRILNSTIKTIALFPTQLTDAQCISLTTL